MGIMNWGDEKIASPTGYREQDEKFEAEQRAKRTDPNRKTYSDWIGYKGPVMTQVHSVEPAVSKGGGLMAMVRFVVDDSFLPATAQGKVLVKHVIYGTDATANGNPRDFAWNNLLKGCNFTYDQIGELMTAGDRNRYMTSVVGKKCAISLGTDESGAFAEVYGFMRHEDYKARAAAGEQVAIERPPKTARVTSTASNGTTTTAPQPLAID